MGNLSFAPLNLKNWNVINTVKAEESRNFAKSGRFPEVLHWLLRHMFAFCLKTGLTFDRLRRAATVFNPIDHASKTISSTTRL